ncbi:MAG: DUF1566 domain-containing protein [Thermodesulfovibrionia bacterium]|nr:DUF1566 domain-containing protein [Thermodesulfovibrionia bacterium]
MQTRIPFIFLSGILVFLVFVTSSEASLIDRGNGLIYDDTLNITWLQDANYSGQTMTWEEANAWAAALIFQSFDDWRLPDSDSCSGSGCSSSEMGHLYVSAGITSDSPGSFINVKPFMYWSSTEYAANNSQAWRYSFKYGTQGVSDKGLTRYAWAARDGDSMPSMAPEPSTAVLFSSGIATLFGLKRRAIYRIIKRK